jgi:hypothetical protein
MPPDGRFIHDDFGRSPVGHWSAFHRILGVDLVGQFIGCLLKKGGGFQK